MTPSPSVRDDHAWSRGRLFWEIAFIGVLVGTGVAVGATPGLTPAAKIAGIVLVLCQVPGYVLLGRSIVGGDERHRLRYVYLLYIAGLFVPATLAAPPAAFALFAIAPLCYLVVHPLPASLTVGVLNVGPIMSMFNDTEATGSDLIQGTLLVAMSVLLSFAFGMWIHRIIQQSHERAELIRSLDATRAELAEVSRHAGMLEERRRMAREIHDTLAQGFSGISMLLQAAEAEPAKDRHYLRLARQAALANLDESRALVSGSLDVVPIPESIRRVAERFTVETGIVTTLDVADTPRRLDPHVEIALLRVTQEALANVRKHSGADTVEVTLAVDEAALRLRVSDDGGGFDAETGHDGHGLPGLRERVARLGGTVDIVSSPRTGTAVTVEVPA